MKKTAFIEKKDIYIEIIAYTIIPLQSL